MKSPSWYLGEWVFSGSASAGAATLIRAPRTARINMTALSGNGFETIFSFLNQSSELRRDRGGVREDESSLAIAHAYGSGQLMIGTELMLFFGLPSMTRSL